MEEEDEDWEEATDSGLCKVSRGIPPNSPVQVLIRVYIVSVRACFDEPRSRFLLPVTPVRVVVVVQHQKHRLWLCSEGQGKLS